ncbi:MAG: HD domain-containing protein, partial [Lutibacter sp.]
MNKQKILSNTIAFVKSTLENAEGGHDWFHIQRVYRNAKLIANTENADIFIVELGALLHDIADSKFYNGNEEIGPKKAREFLISQQVNEKIIEHVEQIIKNISFKGGNFKQTFNSPELEVIQDADRLDAIGAIGIARCFNYGGFKNRTLYDPEIKPKLNQTKEEYKHSKAPTINHF